MVGSLLRFAVAVSFCLALSACGTIGDLYSSDDSAAPAIARVVTPSTPMQCVPYTRTHSGIDIHGDATTWWDQAQGRYERDDEPSIGAVIVLSDYSGPKHAHLAIVRGMDTDRTIRVDHANWLNDGAIYLNDPVADVSPNNDWSAVKVWNSRTHSWGARTYLVRGFIAPQDGSTTVAGDY